MRDGEPSARDGEASEATLLADRQYIGTTSEIPMGRYTARQLEDGTSILVCHHSEGWSALENRCSHMGYPLDGGRMIGRKIICPHHGAGFDVHTGKPMSFPAVCPVQTYPVVDTDGRLYLCRERGVSKDGSTAGSSEEVRQARNWLHRFKTLGEGIDYEERLWRDGKPVLTAWSSGRGLAVPAAYSAASGFVRASAALENDGWPVCVRRTGGGCVPQGPAVANVVWMPGSRDDARGIEHLYSRFAKAMLRGLGAVGINAEIHSPARTWCAGRFDISIGNRKIIGISQRRMCAPHPRALVHAAILMGNGTPAMMSRVNRFLSLAEIGSTIDPYVATSLTEALGNPAIETSSLLIPIMEVLAESLDD